MKFSDRERRDRLVARHHLGKTATDCVEVVSGLAALHSSDPTTPYLACRARVPGFTVEDLEGGLYRDRSVVRMHAIRRTLFVIGRDVAPVFQAGASREIARKERAKLVKWLSAEMAEPRIPGWLDEVAAAVVTALDRAELSTRQLTERVPDLAFEMTVGSGKWSARLPLSSRLLFLLAMEGVLVRTAPLGTWRSSQYRWARTDRWIEAPLDGIDEKQGREGVARLYLATHGPATFEDLRWWSGWTVGQVRNTVSALDVDEVELDGGTTGLVLAEDYEKVAASGTVAFLPSLDSTTMGWKERAWYLGGLASELFDTAGNAGPTVWVDGGVVGGWGQTPDGNVVYELLEDVPARRTSGVAEQATALGEWLGGQVVMPRFPSPLGRRLSAAQ